MNNRPRQNRPSRQRPKAGPGGGKEPPPKYNRSPFSWLVIGLVALSVLVIISRMQTRFDTISYTEFMEYLEAGQIKSVEMGSAEMTGDFNEEGIAARKEKDPKSFKVNNVPAMHEEGFASKMLAKGVDVSGADQDIWVPLLVNLLPILLIVAIIYYSQYSEMENY